jgi:ectoine hydroxylase-related dioxygenase (phytanoyl-CoA dioxygenase family)
MLSPDQISSYRENGYLLIRDALLPGQLATLQRLTNGFIEASRAVSESNDVYDLDEGHSAVQPRLTRIKLPHIQHPAFWEVATSERLTSFLKPLVGEDIRLHTSKLNTKAPGGGAAVEWHSDWAFYPHTNDDMFSVGIMLEDVEAANGPLMVIPGTHKGPALSHHRGGVFCGAIDPADPLFEAGKAVTLTGRAGDMSIHHVRLLHGSAPNMSDRARKILFYEMGAADAWPINGNSAERSPSLPVSPTSRSSCQCRPRPTARRSSRFKKAAARSARSTPVQNNFHPRNTIITEQRLPSKSPMLRWPWRISGECFRPCGISR